MTGKKLKDVFASFMAKFLPGTTMESNAMVKNLNSELLQGMNPDEIVDTFYTKTDSEKTGYLIVETDLGGSDFFSVSIRGYCHEYRWPPIVSFLKGYSINQSNKMWGCTGLNLGYPISASFFMKDGKVNIALEYRRYARLHIEVSSSKGGRNKVNNIDFRESIPEDVTLLTEVKFANLINETPF